MNEATMYRRLAKYFKRQARVTERKADRLEAKGQDDAATLARWQARQTRSAAYRAYRASRAAARVDRFAGGSHPGEDLEQ